MVVSNSVLALTWLLVTATTQSGAQTPVPIHVLKIAAGPSGSEEKGPFVLKEERSIFNRSDDREVIVLFQWSGAAGAHKLAAQWRSPDGSQNSISTIDYHAKDSRFGAYWSLPLSPGIVPFELVRLPESSAARSLSDSRVQGEIIPALFGDEHVLSGGFALGVSRRETIAPSEQREEFSGQEKGFVVFVTMNARTRLRGLLRLRIYDADNRIVAEGKPAKSDFRKEQLTFTSWAVPMLRPPGTYRADVLFDDKPIWRGFVRITP